MLQNEEDVVQSMGRSFFNRVRRGDFDLGRPRRPLGPAGDHHAQQGPQRGRSPFRGEARPPPQAAAPVLRRESVGCSARGVRILESDGPTPAEAAALNEALERRLQDLPEPDLRQVALMKLEGYTNREIAEALRCGERSVERKLNLIRKRWEAAMRRSRIIWRASKRLPGPYNGLMAKGSGVVPHAPGNPVRRSDREATMSDDSQGTQTWIDRIATAFDRAWQAGECPRIEDYLAGVARAAAIPAPGRIAARRTRQSSSCGRDAEC